MSRLDGDTYVIRSWTREGERPINSSSFDWPGSVSDDGCVLYFVSDRPGGYGLHDVYAATRGK